jgi:hypothetical protein
MAAMDYVEINDRPLFKAAEVALCKMRRELLENLVVEHFGQKLWNALTKDFNDQAVWHHFGYPVGEGPDISIDETSLRVEGHSAALTLLYQKRFVVGEQSFCQQRPLADITVNNEAKGSSNITVNVRALPMKSQSFTDRQQAIDFLYAETVERLIEPNRETRKPQMRLERTSFAHS